MLAPHHRTRKDTLFFALMMSMMTLLATLALGAGLFVADVRSSWMNALKGQVTIEIPADNVAGTIRPEAVLRALAQDMIATLKPIKGVAHTRILKRAETEALIEPWLGKGTNLEDMPLPVLIEVTLNTTASDATLDRMNGAIKALDGAARVNTHQDWTSDLQKTSLTLLIAMFTATFMVLACAIMTVLAGVKARLDAAATDIGLLHVMGAPDHFIARAFLRHIIGLVGATCVMGGGAGIGLLFGLGALMPMGAGMLAHSGWSGVDISLLILLPLLLFGLSVGTGYAAVLRHLGKMA